MQIALRGSSPCATTTAILLMTKARQLGMHLSVRLVGDPADIAAVKGPAVVYSPVLASCGIGRELGQGALVVLPGAPGEPLRVSLHSNGTDGWFLVDRAGTGQHAATQAYVRLTQDPRIHARKLAKSLRRTLEVLGMSPDPAVLDILFGAPVPPLTRLSVALRTGRAISGGRGEPITRFLAGGRVTRDPLAAPAASEAAQALADGGWNWILDGFAPQARDAVEAWIEAARQLAAEDQGRDLALVSALAELVSHLVQLPPHSILPPLSASDDGVAIGVKAGLTAEGDDDANAQLGSVFRFLGGKYVADADHAIDMGATRPPPTDDPLGRWRWFCAEAQAGLERADALWPSIVDPPQ
jgi:hypothetical protein